MSKCEELGLEKCHACKVLEGRHCWIDQYISFIDSNGIKDYIHTYLKHISIIKQDHIQYFVATLKYYYPEYLDTFEKLRILV